MSTSILKTILILAIAMVVLSCDNKTENRQAEERLKNFAVRYAHAWSSQEADSVASYFTRDGILRVNEGEPATGSKEIAQVAQGFMTDLPDMLVRYDSLVSKPNAVEFHWTLIATNTGPGGTGNKVNVSGYEVWQLGKDGLIASSQGHFPSEEYNRQLGLGIDAGTKEEFKDIDFSELNMELQNTSELLSPKEIMRKFYPTRVESGEGNESIDMRETQLNNEITEVELIHDNLMDDSVKGKKFVMGLRGKNGKWQIVSLKNNWKCWPGRGSENWGTELCN